MNINDIPSMSNDELNEAINTAARFASNQYANPEVQKHMLAHLRMLLDVQGVRASVMQEPKP